MNNTKNKVLIGSFIGYIGLMMAVFIFSEKSGFSELENRVLASSPKLSFDSVIDGSFREGVDKYLADHFPYRDEFVAIKTATEMSMLKQENNGVYMADDGYLIEKLPKIDKDKIDRNIKHINAFAEKYNVNIMLAPTSLSVYKDKLSKYAVDVNEKELIEYIYSAMDSGIQSVDVFDSLYENNDEYIYFKTDHHWTSRGAYYAYVELCKKLGIDYVGLDKFDVLTVSEDFLGTLFSKGNFVFANSDKIEILKNQYQENIKVEYVFDNIVDDTVYKYDNLLGKDKYGVFLDNNHPLIKITTNVNNGDKIAIIKDSYAHSLIPYLTKHYDEIHVIDLRLFKESIDGYLSENHIKDVFFIYNIKGFASDSNLFRLKY